MEPVEWIALIGGILSLLGVGVNAWQTDKANKRQAEHDEAMAALNHRYREEEAASSFEREATFNQYAADSQKMVEAGLSPALMYASSPGAISSPSASSVGSSQAAGNVGRSVNMSDFLGKLDPAEYAEATIQRMNARTMAEKTRSDISLQKQYEMESISRTLENQRNTAFKKNLETTIFNQEQQKLNQLRIGNEIGEFDLQMKKDTKELEMEKLRLGNKELENKVDLLAEEIKTEPVKRAHLAKDMQQIDAAIQNYYANRDLLQENLRGSALGRIMQECGLNNRHLFPTNMRVQDITKGPWAKQMQAARVALMEVGYSDYEATQACLFYLAQDPKDVTPSLVNGVSRVFSSFIGKK